MKKHGKAGRARRGRSLRIEPLEQKSLLNAGPLVISEFMAQNQTTVTDVDGTYSDWVEIHNPTDAPISLAGWRLTDDAINPTKWTFPDVTLGPDEYLLVFASSKNRTNPASELHTNFALGASGEHLGLIRPDDVVAFEYAPEFPAQYADVSYGSFAGMTGTYLYSPTPGAANLPPGPLVVSEFMAKNTTTLADIDGDYSDWIEIHNPTSEAVDLAGWRLTDSESNLSKWTFPDVALGPGGYLVVFASNKNRTDPASQLHTNFALSTSGEYLGLVRPDGSVAFAHAPSFPDQYADVSYGGLPGEYFVSPTPGAANSAGTATVSGIEFSRAGGVFHEAFTLTLTPLLPDATIRYTTNNSEPNASSTIYTGPISVSVSMTVRAKIFSPLLPSGGIQAAEAYMLMNPTVASWSSNLPVIVIDTFRSQPNENTYVPAIAMFLEPAADGRTQLTDEAVLYEHAAMRIRGSTSATFPKKQYKLEIHDVLGDDCDVSIFGLPTESDWVLYGPYSDKTLMRNFLSYNWSAAMGQYAPRTVFCEVFVNQNNVRVDTDDYVGLYVLVEQITIDENRVDIQEISGGTPENPTVTGGAILKVDRYDTDEYYFTGASGTRMVVHNPKIDELNTAERQYLVNYIGAFETALYGPNFKDPEIGYAAYIDVDSFIDEHILVEMTKQIDGYRLSNYYYFDQDTKLTSGPVWDYNLSLGNADYLEGNIPTGWYYPLISDRTQYPYYTRLFEDPDFRQQYVDRWAELRQTIFATDTIMAQIADTVSYIAEAEARDHARWPTLGVYVWPNGYVGQTYADEINYMSNFLSQRLQWIDSQFLAAPIFDQEGGDVEPGTAIEISLPEGSTSTIYYTVDGSDPRLPGGGVSPMARIAGPHTVDATVIEMDAVWRYNDTGTDLGTVWRVPGYDFSAWASGPAELGYGDGDEATIVSYGGNSSSKHPTTYFVKTFDVLDAASFDSLTIDLMRDDGAVVYLNGQEVARSNMPTGTITYNTLASLASDDGKNVFSYTIDPSLLVEGTNYIAVEVHQTQLNSSDLSFNLALRATSIDPGAVVIDESLLLTARAFSGSQWSAPTSALYVTSAHLTPVVSEIMYHPADPTSAEIAAGFDDSEDFEFIELYNPHDVALSLAGIRIIDGIEFDFSTGSDVLWLEPGEYLLVVRDEAAFNFRYDAVATAPVAGEYSGKLDNAGERVALVNDNDEVFQDITYSDDPPWPVEADGSGSSLEARIGFRHESDPAHWFASAVVGGTPGWIGVAPVLLPGDANLDGTVGELDAKSMGANWGETDATWVMGDFNGDGKVDAVDAAVLAAHWGAVRPAPEASPTPEPVAVENEPFVGFVGPLRAEGPAAATRPTIQRPVRDAAILARSRLVAREESLGEAAAQPTAAERDSAARAAAVDAALADAATGESLLLERRLAWSHLVARRQNARRSGENEDQALATIELAQLDRR